MPSTIPCGTCRRTPPLYTLLLLALFGCGKSDTPPPPATDATPVVAGRPAEAGPVVAGGIAPANPAVQGSATPYFYNRVVAVCIGIEKYESAKVDIAPDAEQDARRIADLFRTEYGYEVVELFGQNATRAAITAKLDKYRAELGEKDALIVYFSGHGLVLDLPSFGRAGYLVPFDAALSLRLDTDPAEWSQQALDMAKLTEDTISTKAQHVLFIVNACCSGFMAHRGPNTTSELVRRVDLQEVMARRSRAVFAATTDRQSATSGSGARFGRFTTALDSVLRSRRPASVTEVFIPVREEVASKSERTMLPQFGMYGSEDGEFVFLPKAIPAGDVAAVLRNIAATSHLRAAKWTTTEHLHDLLDTPDYRFSPRRVDREREWEQRLTRFRTNAALGDSLAMAATSVCYARGLGTAPDPKEAYRLARLAYDTKRPEGQYALGLCLANGVGVERSALAGRELLEKAVESGFPLAALPLADGLTEGKPSPEATRRAVELLTRAEKAAGYGATIRLVALAAKAQPVATAEQVAGWVERLKPPADRNMAVAQYMTYELLTRDPARMTDPNREKAYQHLLKAAEAGHAIAQVRLAAEHYQKEWFKGRLGRPQDFAAAREWAMLAAQGSYDANKMLAMIYVLGDGVEVDVSTAKGYYAVTRSDKYAYDHEWSVWYIRAVTEVSERPKK